MFWTVHGIIILCWCSLCSHSALKKRHTWYCFLSNSWRQLHSGVRMNQSTQSIFICNWFWYPLLCSVIEVYFSANGVDYFPNSKTIKIDACIVSNTNYVSILPVIATYYSGISLLRTPSGLHVSWLKRCPYFRGLFVHFFYVAGTTGSVLIRQVSLYRRSLIERFHCMPLVIVVIFLWCGNHCKFQPNLAHP